MAKRSSTLSALSLACILQFLFGALSIPLSRRQLRWPLHRKQTEEPSYKLQYAMDYLSKYGYLRKINQIEMRDAKEFHHAIRRFQNFSGLANTGYLDLETIEKMKIPRCGVQDFDAKRIKFDIRKIEEMPHSPSFFPELPDSSENRANVRHLRHKRYALMGKWPKNVITYKFNSYTEDMSIEEQREAIARAFQIWSDSTALTFREVWDDEVDILISFLRGDHQDGYPFDGNGQTLAHAFFPGQGSRSGDAHFDDDEKWTNEIEESEGTNLYMVAAHEFGHALGLGHSSYADSVMLPFYQGYMSGFALGEDDKRAILHLYGNTVTSNRIGSIYQEGFNPYPPPTIIPVDKEPPSDGLARDGLHLSREKVPSICNHNFDAVVNIRSEIFFIKDKVYWRLNADGDLVSDEEMPMTSFWSNFPDVQIDAAFTRPSDQNIVFIAGDRYWVYYDNNNMDPRSPRPISDFGLHESIDAALVWVANKKVYFYKGNKYWKLDDRTGKVSPSYPKNISTVMKGIPNDLDAALNHPDGYSYYLKGKQCWKMDDKSLSVSPGYPKFIGEQWFGCDPSIYRRDLESTSSPQLGTSKGVGGNGATSCRTSSLQLHAIIFVSFSIASFGKLRDT